MSKRNAQDSYQAAMLQWELLRNPNQEAQPTPKSADPHAVLRRRDGVTTRVTDRVVTQNLRAREANRLRQTLRRRAA